MAKRFTATEIWSEDWFLDMPMEYKLFWYYMLSTCNHAGFFKVNLRSFCGLNGVNLTSKQVLEYFNAGKQRIRVINDSLWLIDDFFVYQYGATLNPNNRVHNSIVKEYLKYGIELTSIRGLKDLKHGVKDKDKDIITPIEYETKNNYTTGLVVEMAKVFKKYNPLIEIIPTVHYPPCLQIAYRIAKMKGWEQKEVLNGKMSDTLKSWEKIVEFTKTEDYLASRSLIDFNNQKEWDRLVSKMQLANKPISKKQNEGSPIKKESEIDWEKYKPRKQ